MLIWVKMLLAKMVDVIEFSFMDHFPQSIFTG